MLNAALLQIPDALALWLRSTLVQKMWISLFGCIGGFGVIILFLHFSISALWFHVMEQVRNPLDMGNAWILAEYFVWIVVSGVSCRLGWIAISVYVHSAVREFIIFAKLFLAVSQLSICLTTVFTSNGFEWQTVYLMLALIVFCKPANVDFTEHMLSSIGRVVLPCIVYLFDNTVQPIVPLLQELKSGPVCAFYPDTVWCNVSLAAVGYLLKGPNNIEL
jgi:hypothetical protein